MKPYTYTLNQTVACKRCGRKMIKNRANHVYCSKQCGQKSHSKKSCDKIKSVKELALKVSKGLISKSALEKKMNQSEKKRLNKCLFRIYCGGFSRS